MFFLSQEDGTDGDDDVTAVTCECTDSENDVTPVTRKWDEEGQKVPEAIPERTTLEWAKRAPRVGASCRL
jgi:hypothetical protein